LQDKTATVVNSRNMPGSENAGCFAEYVKPLAYSLAKLSFSPLNFSTNAENLAKGFSKRASFDK
jgi:hypothetical protein